MPSAPSAARDAASGATLNKVRAHSLTFMSVVCAESMTATRSWSGDA